MTILRIQKQVSRGINTSTLFKDIIIKKTKQAKITTAGVFSFGKKWQ
jgi:hypothetical protein